MISFIILSTALALITDRHPLIDHSKVDRPENIWGESPDYPRYGNPFYKWWTDLYRGRWERGDKRPSYEFFQSILGFQNTTVMFTYRCRVWHRPDEGWTLYVDKRGPHFHVRAGMTPEEAWEAFEKFKSHFRTKSGAKGT
jgi:hypothetical protein